MDVAAHEADVVAPGGTISGGPQALSCLCSKRYTGDMASTLYQRCVKLLTLGLAATPVRLGAQAPDDGSVELYGLLTGIALESSVGETTAGVGARVAYNVSDHLAIEAEAVHFPENPAGNYGQTLALAGARIGQRSNNIGYFVTLKTGILHFGGSAFEAYHGSTHTNLALDAGFALEYRPSPRFILRFDFANAIIPFGNTVLGVPSTPYTRQPGTTHNRHSTLAVGFRL